MSDTQSTESYNASDYERRYQQGYGLMYPESHIIRINKQILDWEFGIRDGLVFDFGCGTGANLRYFTEQGFTPFGCDTSETAIAKCKEVMPDHEANFHATEVDPDLVALIGRRQLALFMSNQVLYFLDDERIANITRQAYEMVRPGGVFVATMMSYSCWYAKAIDGREGDFQQVSLDTPRQSLTTLINFKDRSELEELFSPFRKLHIGAYGSWIREEEGSTDHWIFVGIRD
jgi:SAM-dependent methyltransferase